MKNRVTFNCGTVGEEGIFCGCMCSSHWQLAPGVLFSDKAEFSIEAPSEPGPGTLPMPQKEV